MKRALQPCYRPSRARSGSSAPAAVQGFVCHVTNDICREPFSDGVELLDQAFASPREPHRIRRTVTGGRATLDQFKKLRAFHVAHGRQAAHAEPVYYCPLRQSRARLEKPVTCVTPTREADGS